MQSTLGLGFNTKINNSYGKLSLNSSILDESGYRNNYIGIGLGKRYQTTKYNLNWIAGLSYLFGRVKVIDSLQNSYYGRVGFRDLW